MESQGIRTRASRSYWFYVDERFGDGLRLEMEYVIDVGASVTAPLFQKRDNFVAVVQASFHHGIALSAALAKRACRNWIGHGSADQDRFQPDALPED